MRASKGQSHAVRTIGKVTAFVTRRTNPQAIADLLVFRHPDAGIQLPAGTIEPGEDPPAAVVREVEEETGLRDVRIVTGLGTSTMTLGEAAAFSERAPLRQGPSPRARRLATMPRGWWCRVVNRQHDYAEVIYEELDRNCDPQPVLVRYSGWVQADHLAERLERTFFHIECLKPTPECWLQRAEDRFEFACQWLPLAPVPALSAPQQVWLDECYPALMASLARQLTAPTTHKH